MATTGPKQLSNQRVSVEKVNSSIAPLHVVTLDTSGSFVSPGAGSTQVSIKEILSSSGGSLIDSTNVSLGVTIRAGSASGTEYTDGDVDASISGGAILFDNSSNTLRPVTLTRGLPVNVVAGSAASTTVNVSSLAGAVIVRSSAANLLASVYQSTAADLNVTVAGYVAPSTTVQVSSVGGIVKNQIVDRDQSTQVAAVLNAAPASTVWALAVRDVVPNSTTVNVSSLAGAVIVRSSAANALVTAYQSSAADLNVTVANLSTTHNVSSLSGRVQIAAFHAVDGAINVADSTNNAINVNVVAGAAAGSTLVTVRQSTYTDFNTLSRLADRDNSTKVAAVLSETQPASTAYGLVVRMPAPITDSTESALRVNVVAGAAGGSTLVTVRQSTYTDFNTLSRLADRDQSTQVANITNTTPASTAYGLVVREAVPQSTTVNVSSLAGAVIVRSSAANFLASVYQSTAADLNVTVAGYSTTVNVSSLGGAVIVRSSAANLLQTAYQSTAADLQATVTLASTGNTITARVTTSSGGGVEGSTTTLSTGSALGLNVRPVQPSGRQSTSALFTSSNSTVLFALTSSEAGVRQKVYAFSVTSTVTNPSTFHFCSVGSSDNTTIERWSLALGSGSSGVTGANLAVTPPAFLFETVTADAIKCKIENGASTQTIARVSLAWFSEA